MTIDVNEKNRRLVKLASSPNSRFWRIDYGALSLPERVFRAVWELEAEVNGGAFHHISRTTPEASLRMPLTRYAIGATTMQDGRTSCQICRHVLLVGRRRAERSFGCFSPGAVAKPGEM